MSGLLLLVGSMVIFFVAYVTYGSWLCKKWGVDPTRKTPAERLCDNVDYMPTKPAVLMGHHFSSIAGAGPIVGPITAAVFGWVPVMLWILIGSIFFGGVHDFGALYSSIRFDGKTIGQIIDATLGKSGKFLFSIFAYVTLLVVIAAFANIVAATFVASPQAATASLLFIVLAVIFGFSVYRCGLSLGVGTVIGVIMLVVAIAIGNMYPLHLSKNVWVCILMVYIFVASIAPVWILLQPRDYLSSYLLYGMIALALVGIVGAGVTGAATNLDIPAFTGFTAVKGDSKVATTGFCSRRCLLPSHAARFRASIAWWLRARRPSSSTMKAKHSPSPMAACCSSAWSPLFRCAPWRSCSTAIWTAPTRRPRRFSQAASLRCSAASPAFLALRTLHTRC